MKIRKNTLELSVTDENCYIHPSSGKNIAVLEGANGTVTFHATTTSASIGDEITLIVKRNSLEDAWAFLFSTNMIFTACRTIETEEFSPSGYSWVGHFFYDGSKFINTYEDC